MTGPTFKAITKGNGPATDGSKTTLTNLWKKKEEASNKSTQQTLEEINIEDEEELQLATAVNAEDAITPVATDAEQPAMEAAEEVTHMEVDDASAPVAEAKEASQGGKKRKRSSKTPEQLAALQALFSADPYPSAAAKKECAEKIGLEVSAVSNWFDTRRKQARADNALPPKRGKADKQSQQSPPDATNKPESEAEKQKESTAAAAAEDVAMEEAGAGPSATAPEPTPASTATPPSTAPATGKTQGTATSSKAPASMAGASKAAAGASVALPSKEEQAKLLVELAAEAVALRTRGLMPPLSAIPADAAPKPFTDAALASYVVGQQLPLTQLVSRLQQLFGPAEGTDAAPIAEALRTRIVDMAVRKSHNPADKDPKAAAPRLDALEAVPTEGTPSLWQWELRDAKVLPKAQRADAAAIKRRAGRVGDRLTAVVRAHEALSKLASGEVKPAKVAKVLEALAKAETLAQMEAVAAAEARSVAAKEADKAMQAEEKERLRLEKEEEKERLRLEKEAEKEKARQEAEKARLAKKTGFKDKEALNKTANKFMNFFKAAAPAKPKQATAPAVAAAPTAAAGTASGTPQDSGAAVAAAEPNSVYAALFLKPPTDHVVAQPLQPLTETKIDAGLAAEVAAEEAVEQLQAWLAERAAARRAASAAPPAGIGLPPSWARRPGGVEAAAARLAQMRGSGVDPAAVKTWRRKFVWFGGDSKRPPYYGSWPAPGPGVGPRRYLGKDEMLDYEVMSDLEWEEEPEGSSLSGADEEEKDDAVDSGEEDSFMVADGYLSEDEGVRLEDEMDAETGGDSLKAEMAAAMARAGAGSDATARTRCSAAMQIALDRARRAGKPLVVVRADVAAAVAAAAGEGSAVEEACLQGDAAVLEALAMEVLMPGFSFLPPSLDPAEDAAAQATAVGAAAAGGSGAGGASGASQSHAKRGERPDDLIPALAAFIQANATASKPKMVEGFIASHLDRKMSKKWVGEKISELAQRTGNKWVLKCGEVVVLQPAGGGAAAAGAGAKPATTAAAEATPHAAAGPLDRMMARRQHATAGGSMPTPQVPSALRPGAPPSAIAPECLVTVTDAGHAAAVAAAAPLPELRVPVEVESTGEPYWTVLLQHIEAEGIPVPSSYTAAFAVDALAKHARCLPAFILAALLTAAQGAGRAEAGAEAVRCLRGAVDALASIERSAGDAQGVSSASQRAWGDARMGPKSATLAELCREPALMAVLQRAVQGGLGAAAASDALSVAATLGSCPALKEASTEGVRSAIQACGAASDGAHAVLAAAALAAWPQAEGEAMET